MLRRAASFGRRPSHVRTPSAESLSSDIIDDLSSSASTVIFEPSQPPSPTLDLEALAELVKQQTGDNTTLIQLNGALLNALRAERARSDALQQQIEGQENKTEDDAQPPAIARARSADAVNNANRNRNAGRFSTAVDENTAASNRPQSAGKIGQLAKYVKPASRRPLVKRSGSRVLVDPLGAPLRTGSLVTRVYDDEERKPLVAKTTTPTAEEAQLDEEQMMLRPWPEPAASPPPKRSAKARSASSQKLGHNTNVALPPLSSGLASRLRRSLSEEVQRLQERLQGVLTADPQPEPAEYAKMIGSLTRRLGWLRSDISALAPHEAANAAAAAKAKTENDEGSEGFAPLLELVTAAEDFAASLNSELKSKARAEAEAKHAAALCKGAGLSVCDVPHDGDCLFACAHEWLKTRPQKPPKDDDDDEEEEEAAADAVASLCSSVSDVRGLVVDLMRERAGGASSAANGSLDEGLVQQMVQAVRQAACSTSANDGTSAAMRTALATRGVNALSCKSATLIEIYLEVMGRNSIYGERSEIDTLAALLNVPIHIYYYMEEPDEDAVKGEEVSKKKANDGFAKAPSEVVVPDGVDRDAQPLRLLHLVHQRHFSLLTKQAASEKAAADEEVVVEMF